ncbi:MAG: hypothetical protein JXQ72_05405, partial [Anaerolineae bacterium]|nr:hypothetical protein [Anaerolineae bacterium]
MSNRYPRRRRRGRNRQPVLAGAAVLFIVAGALFCMVLFALRGDISRLIPDRQDPPTPTVVEVTEIALGTPTSTPTSTATLVPSVTVSPTASPTLIPTAADTVTPEPSATVTATATETATATGTPTHTPTHTLEPSPTETVLAVAASTTTPEPSATAPPTGTPTTTPEPPPTESPTTAPATPAPDIPTTTATVTPDTITPAATEPPVPTNPPTPTEVIADLVTNTPGPFNGIDPDRLGRVWQAVIDDAPLEEIAEELRQLGLVTGQLDPNQALVLKGDNSAWVLVEYAHNYVLENVLSEETLFQHYILRLTITVTTDQPGGFCGIRTNYDRDSASFFDLLLYKDGHIEITGYKDGWVIFSLPVYPSGGVDLTDLTSIALKTVITFDPVEGLTMLFQPLTTRLVDAGTEFPFVHPGLHPDLPFGLTKL